MKILLTGGTGFFGKAILRHLRQVELLGAERDSFQVVVMSRNPLKFLTAFPEFKHFSWLTFHEGDILNSKSFPKGGSFTDVLHAAADSVTEPGFTAIDRLDQIVTGTRNTLDFALAADASRFLLVSSGAVYGAQPADMVAIPESYHVAPDSLNINNVYGLAKRQAELLCAIYHADFGLHTKIARCFAFVGPDLPLAAHFAIGNFIKNAVDKTPIIVAGDGTPLRSYLYQDDLAKWLFEILLKGTAGQAYNVGSDQAISIRELAYLVQHTLCPDVPVTVLGVNQGPNRNQYIPSIEKIKTELGVQIHTSLMRSIQLTASAAKLT
jgi:UDP-glucuronate decarboxylase